MNLTYFYLSPRLDGFCVSITIVKRAQGVESGVSREACCDDRRRSGHRLSIVEKMKSGVIDADGVALVGNKFSFEGRELIVQVGIDGHEIVIPPVRANVEACPSS